VVTVPLPGREACESIIQDTLTALAQKFPALRSLGRSAAATEAAALCVGLDGRRIRKVIVSALALYKEVALDPSKLKGAHLLEAAREARAEAGLDGRAQ